MMGKKALDAVKVMVEEVGLQGVIDPGESCGGVCWGMGAAGGAGGGLGPAWGCLSWGWSGSVEWSEMAECTVCRTQ